MRALLRRAAGAIFGAKKTVVPSPAPAPRAADPKTFELAADQVRYTPDAAKLPESSKDIPNDDKQVVGQDDALKAIRFGLEMKPDHYNLFVAGADGGGRAMAVRRILSEIAPTMKTPNDLVAATNFADKDVPVVLEFAPGKGAAFADGVEGFVENLKERLPARLQSGSAAQKKQALMDKVQAAAAKLQADFDAKIASIRLVGGKFGVHVKASQTSKGIQIALAVAFAGAPLTQQDVGAKVAAGAFTAAEFAQAQAELAEKKGGILEEYQVMLRASLQMTQKVQGLIEQIDAQAVAAVVTEHANELAQAVVNGPATAADKAFQKRAQERDAELNEALQLFGRQKFGSFTVAVKAGMGQDGPVVAAVPAFEGVPLTDAKAVAALIEAGKFTRKQYEEAAAEIAKKAKAIQDKMAEFVAATRKEQEALQAKKPKAGPEAHRAVAYIQSMAQFAASNYKIFLGPIKETDDESGLKPVPGSRPLDPADFFRVSVLVDNARQKGAPVVFEQNPTYENLFGAADANDRSMIIPSVGLVKTAGPGGPTLKAGAFLKANGGFLVLSAMDALKNPAVWPALMRAVRSGQAEIAEGGLLGVASMKGDIYQVPGKVKVVLIGSPMVQMLLAKHDEDFVANFQSVAQFQPTIKITEEAVGGFLNFLKHAVVGSAGEVLDMTRGAMGRVLEQAARLADSNKQFTSQFGALYGLLQEATYWAQKSGRDMIQASDVDTALTAKSDREDVHYQRMRELYQKNVFRVDTEGSAVGQINGLAVMGSHGVQMRITFVASPGAPGIVSVDKDAGRTGPDFNKALGNEYGFLMNEFGQKKALRAQIRVSYEQNYGGIDGDSSTSTTLYGILSALSGVPISQKFAVTGSADQFGNVQAIGGVNEKIEGFFALCNHRGLTGDQGVIIPKTNVGNLQLSPEVAQAIKDGRFHIYAVDTVAQGMEILTGVAYQTIKEKAAARLDDMGKPDPTTKPGPGSNYTRP
ncbi:MAG: hypothetical protein A2V88_16460 [Elusimicrobia bacterium RBG_16_66_12]|nr:MAG: hypothetical protein A2V88_16460 [Elusimicrobia bacterium RBG_16_66_12]